VVAPALSHAVMAGTSADSGVVATDKVARVVSLGRAIAACVVLPGL